MPVRILLALALTLALVAGCTEPGPRDAASGTETPSPTRSTTATTTGGNGFAVQQGTAHGSSHGIDIDVAWRACDKGFCANATATNRGTQTVKVSSICVPPWDERMAHDGEAVSHRPPQVYCQAFGRADFAPGHELQRDVSWDGKLYEGETPSDAPEGSYTWSIVFWWDDGQGGARQEAVADIQLVVGET